MTNRLAPWDDIKTPSSDYNVRLIASSKAVPLFWGKDTEGHCLFIVELEGDHGEQFQKSRVSIRGIGVDLRMLTGSGKQGLVLRLEQQVDRLGQLTFAQGNRQQPAVCAAVHLADAAHRVDRREANQHAEQKADRQGADRQQQP